MFNILLAVLIIIALMLVCTSLTQWVSGLLRGDGLLPTTIDYLADRSVARSAVADVDREYEELLAREGR